MFCHSVEFFRCSVPCSIYCHDQIQRTIILTKLKNAPRGLLKRSDDSNTSRCKRPKHVSTKEIDEGDDFCIIKIYCHTTKIVAITTRGGREDLIEYKLSDSWKSQTYIMILQKTTKSYFQKCETDKNVMELKIKLMSIRMSHCILILFTTLKLN